MTRREKRYADSCQYCGRRANKTRRDWQYCSNACKQAAYRERKEQRQQELLRQQKAAEIAEPLKPKPKAPPAAVPAPRPQPQQIQPTPLQEEKQVYFVHTGSLYPVLDENGAYTPVNKPGSYLFVDRAGHRYALDQGQIRAARAKWEEKQREVKQAKPAPPAPTPKPTPVWEPSAVQLKYSVTIQTPSGEVIVYPVLTNGRYMLAKPDYYLFRDREGNKHSIHRSRVEQANQIKVLKQAAERAAKNETQRQTEAKTAAEQKTATNLFSRLFGRSK